MTTNNESAKIFDMEDARARRRASELPGADFEDVGAHLAAVRETSGLTIAEAAAKTHIREAHLEAIEALDIPGLPARPYAIGFVKAYAEFLALDAPAIVERFKEDAGFSAPAKIDVGKFEAAEAATTSEAGELSLAAVIAIIVFFIWCAWQITLLDREPILAPGAGLPVAATTPDASAILDPAAAPVSDPALAEIIEARIIERIEPVFPRACLADAKPEEIVMVSFNISASGRVTGERVASASNACFEASALNAVRRWQFEPRKIDGAARPVFDQKAQFLFQRPQ